MRALLLLLALALVPATASAQGWSFETTYPSDPDRQGSSGHGIAVDPDGKVWIQYFSATDSVQVPEFNNEWRDTRVIYVFNSDGSEATGSPIKFVDLPGGVVDTLGGAVIRNSSNELVWDGKSNRGLRADQDGNILASQFNTLYKLDYTSPGTGLAKNVFPDYCALTQATYDVEGNVYVAPVCPGPPVRILNSDLSFQANVADASSNFSRGVIVSRDGLNFYETAYENTFTIVHQRPDVFTPFDSTGTTFHGMRTESAAINPSTGYLWVSSGNPLNPPNQDVEFTTNWQVATWYAFDAANDVLTGGPADNGGIVKVPMALDSLTWNNQADGRPRGLAFTPDGNTAYVAQFSEPAPSFQRFTRGPVAIERGPEVEGVARLEPNAPNPAVDATDIRFVLDAAAHATVRLYDVQGRQIAVVLDEALAAGTYSRTVTTSDLPAGTYVYTLEVEGRAMSRRMLVVR